MGALGLFGAAGEMVNQTASTENELAPAQRLFELFYRFTNHSKQTLYT
jgi:hypothetical protein